MTRMPTFEEIRDDFERGVRTAEEHIEHPFRRTAAAPQTPAPQPATMAAVTARPKETPMSLATLEDDVKTDLTQGLDWLEGFVGRVKQAAPGIIATSEAVAGSTVGQLAEMFLGKILPPDVETELLAIVSRYVTTFGQPVQAAAAPQPPVQ